MTNYNYNINSHDLARKLIKSCSTALLISILQACEQTPKQHIDDTDRAELEHLLEEIA